MGKEYPKGRRRVSGQGFTAIPNAVLRDKTLPPSAKLAYGAILSYAWGNRRCTASSGRLADDAGIGRSAFFEALAILRERDLLDVQKVKGPNGWRNAYTPLMTGLTISDEAESDGSSAIRTTPGGVVRVADGGSSATRTEKKTKGEEDEETPTHSTAPASDEWPEGIKNPAAADAIFAVVDAMAREHGAKVVTKRALGHAMLSAPGRDFIGEAHRMASYYVGRRVRDAVATYRNWLGKAEERYTPPVGVAASAQNGSAPMRPRRNGRSTVADYMALLPVADEMDAADAAAGRVVA